MATERELRERNGSHKRSRNYSRKLRERTPLFEPGVFIEPRRFRIIFPEVDTSPISRWPSRPIWDEIPTTILQSWSVPIPSWYPTHSLSVWETQRAGRKKALGKRASDSNCRIQHCPLFRRCFSPNLGFQRGHPTRSKFLEKQRLPAFVVLFPTLANRVVTPSLYTRL